MPLEESMISDIMPAFTCIAPFSSMEVEKNLSFRESGPTSRVAIQRDPDYDRSYKRYIRNLPLYQNFNLPPFNMMQSPNCQMGPISQELMSLLTLDHLQALS
ncbi:unnamed protein product [Eruca vesicaria subsp. sativa]|uniref:Uncharacterized protein n=1 Tax=Eruca vesicaria subsp. sativa TaxID=29727 RepID=A0ABC8JRH9_ERUVS|nr:unnamed protein product [Eruca vesicaria subsp. sativa]